MDSAWGRIWVRQSRPEANPEQTQKTDLRFGWGMLSVRFGLVGTVHVLTCSLYHA